MTLTKRLLLLVVPILLAGVVLASYGVYKVQTQTLEKVAQNRLDVKLLRAKVGFESESAVSRNLILLLLEGNALGNFARSVGIDRREYLVTQRLDYLVNDVIEEKQTQLALTIFGANGEPLYHYERSDNPFSNVPSYLPVFASSMFAKGELESEKLMFLDNNEHAYVYGRVVSATTSSTPIRGGLDDNIIIVATVFTNTFDQELAALRKEYDSLPLIIHRAQGLPVPEDESWRSIPLMRHYDLDLQLTDDYLRQVNAELVNWMLIAAVLLGSGITAMLLLLIKRYIIRPIETLDRQLNLVIAERQVNIQRPVGIDEVSSLGIKFYDLYEQLQSNLRESRTLAVTDALTKLPNRTRFHEFAKRALVKAWNRNAHMSLIYIDLDNFKFVNDRLGHEAGDELLQEVGSAFQQLLQSEQYRQYNALASRLAGDEFAIVFAHDRLDDRLGLAQNVVDLFEGGFKTRRYITPVSASIGIASYPNDGEDLRDLIANADMAMYHAKRTGKNRFAAYSHSIAREARRVKLIEDALKFVNCDEEFSLVYMPFVDQEQHVRGLEVLLRWYSPELGQITPDEFVPIAEQTGTYAKIDDWVFRNAFQNLSTLRAFLGDEVVIAINISAGELGQAAFADKLVQLKQEFNVPDRSVELEITETFGYFAVEQVLSVLRELREAGFGISIDDFGIGYTPLLQMIDYPVDKVKFDKKLVHRFTSEDNHPLLQPTVELCHLQSIEVTAEGVENEAEFTQLKAGGCDYFQGYAVAQPMTMAELRSWFKHYRNRLI